MIWKICGYIAPREQTKKRNEVPTDARDKSQKWPPEVEKEFDKK